jgi:hypothetical protein
MVAKKVVNKSKKKVITKRSHNQAVKPAEVEVLEASDNIISTLTFANPCPIRLEIGIDRVSLYIGQRDMQWSRYTKEHIASGTAVAPDEPVEHEETVEEVMSDVEEEEYAKGCAQAVEEEQMTPKVQNK